MAKQRMQLRIVSGPNQGDVIALELGTCRLIGRHLSEGETAGFDLEGRRVLDGHALKTMTEHFKKEVTSENPSLTRGPDVVLNDDAISRAHAMFFYDVEGAGIIDLASTNGTYVNNKAVSTSMLKDQDRVTMGHIEWIVEL